MGQHKESILIWCLAVQLFTSLVLGGLATAGVVSGGIALQTTIPSSAWSAVTDGIIWWSCLTFQISGGGYIASVFFWFLTIVEALMLLLIIRGD